MRRSFLPTSIAGRLFAASAVLIVIAVVLAGAGTAFTMQRFIRGQIDQRLTAQLATVAAALSIEDGQLRLTRPVDIPPFDRRRSGWAWQARLGEQVLDSRELVGDEPPPGPRQRPPPDAGDRDFGPNWRDRPGDHSADDPAFRQSMSVTVDGQTVDLTATASSRALAGPMIETLRPVAATMLVLGLCLALTAVFQLRAALRPLARLRGEVEAVRAGRASALTEDQPQELKPLVTELNRLITQNAEGLERARGHVSNLGHALNTPLASLALALAEGPHQGDLKNLDLVRRMQDHIRHHLGRARAAALGGPTNVSTEVAPHVGDIAEALSKIHAERAIRFEAHIPAGCAVACEKQDFDEMVGNLLDNAFKWARSRVTLSIEPDCARIAISIDDDGDGLDSGLAPQALMPGRRLDEATPGTGFGLPIARELAELYGGALDLQRGPLGGLRARLLIPPARS